MPDLAPTQLRQGAAHVAAVLQRPDIPLLGRRLRARHADGPSAQDYDIATSALPDQVLQLFPHAMTVCKAFGVVRAPWRGHYYEVATFRKDFAYRDGRRRISWCSPAPPKTPGAAISP